MSTPSSSVEPGPDQEAAGAGGASSSASPDFTVANRLSFSNCTVALNATPGAVYLESNRAGQTDGRTPAGSRGLGKRQVKRWGFVVLTLALAAAALAGYGFRGWHEAQNTVEPRGPAQVDKGLPSSAKDTRPLAADMPVVTGPASTNTLLSDFEKTPDDAAKLQRIQELEAQPAARVASKATATLPVTGDLPSGRDLQPADDGAGEADPGLPAIGTVTKDVASELQSKPGKTAAPITRQNPVSDKTASCPAELSALQLCPLLSK